MAMLLIASQNCILPHTTLLLLGPLILHTLAPVLGPVFSNLMSLGRVKTGIPKTLLLGLGLSTIHCNPGDSHLSRWTLCHQLLWSPWRKRTQHWLVKSLFLLGAEYLCVTQGFKGHGKNKKKTPGHSFVDDETCHHN